MNDFPTISNCIIYKKVPNDPELCIMIDVFHEEEYLVDRQIARFARSLDGKTDPYKIPGFSHEDVFLMLVFLNREGLIRNDRIEVFCGTVVVPVLRLKGKTALCTRILCLILNKVLEFLWLPVLLAGVFMCRNFFSQPQPDLAGAFGVMIGVIPGIVMHEVGHAIAGVACGGRVFEFGLFLRYVMPGAYTIVHTDGLPNRKKFQIDAAGVEMNCLLAGLFMILSSLRPTGELFGAVLFYAGGFNLVLALTNCALLKGLDGAHMARDFFHFDIVQNSRMMLTDRTIRKQLLTKRGVKGKAIFAVDLLFVSAQFGYFIAIMAALNVIAWTIA